MKGQEWDDWFRSQCPKSKEEMMKRFVYLTVVFMIGVIMIGCSTMTAEQRKETYDLRSSVGNRPFVGDSSSEAQKAALGIGRY